MANPFFGYRTFFQQFRANFHSTGSIVPSSRFLSAALARNVRDGASDTPRRILEVGPGTGPVTKRLVTMLGPNDSLDLVELNDAFVAALKKRFENEETFRKVRDRCRVLHCPVEELQSEEPYDLMISGLPFNNFAVADVERILKVFERLLKPDGVLSFFEYVGVRPIRGSLSKENEKQRLQGIGRVLDEFVKPREIRRNMILFNFPPAWVHHLRMSRAS